jgi:hypothetical protein
MRSVSAVRGVVVDIALGVYPTPAEKLGLFIFPFSGREPLAGSDGLHNCLSHREVLQLVLELGEAAMEGEVSAAACAAIQTAWASAYEAYQALLAQGVAREMARSVLPVSMFTTFVWKVDLWNLFHSLDLRMDLHAQEQIRVYAEAIHAILQGLAPEALSAFDDYIRNAFSLTHLEVKAIRAAVAAGSPLITAEVETENRRERAEWHGKRTFLFGRGLADA